MARCTTINLVFSVVVLVTSSIFIVDLTFRKLNASIRKARFASFVTLAIQTALFTIEHDASNSVVSSVLNSMYMGFAGLTLLYYCEIFSVVYLDLPAQKSQTLLRIVKWYPIHRVIFLLSASIGAIVVALYANNASRMAVIGITAFIRYTAVVPTLVLMIRLSLKLSRHRMLLQASKTPQKTTKKIEWQLMFFGVAALIMLVTISIVNLMEFVELSNDPNGRWIRVCATPTPGGVARTTSILVGLILTRASMAEWKVWTPCGKRDMDSTSGSRSAKTTRSGTKSSKNSRSTSDESARATTTDNKHRNSMLMMSTKSASSPKSTTTDFSVEVGSFDLVDPSTVYD